MRIVKYFLCVAVLALLLSSSAELSAQVPMTDVTTWEKTAVFGDPTKVATFSPHFMKSEPDSVYNRINLIDTLDFSSISEDQRFLLHYNIDSEGSKEAAVGIIMSQGSSSYTVWTGDAGNGTSWVQLPVSFVGLDDVEIKVVFDSNYGGKAALNLSNWRQIVTEENRDVAMDRDTEEGGGKTGKQDETCQAGFTYDLQYQCEDPELGPLQADVQIVWVENSDYEVTDIVSDPNSSLQTPDVIQQDAQLRLLAGDLGFFESNMPAGIDPKELIIVIQNQDLNLTQTCVGSESNDGSYWIREVGYVSLSCPGNITNCANNYKYYALWYDQDLSDNTHVWSSTTSEHDVLVPGSIDNVNGVMPNGLITMQAGEYIAFEPGFEHDAGASSGNVLTADVIDNQACTSKVRFAPETQLEDDIPALDIKIAPNPVQDYAWLSIISTETTRATIDLLDLHGKVISQAVAQTELKKGNNEVPFVLPNCLPGVYIIRIHSNLGTQSIKIVKI